MQVFSIRDIERISGIKAHTLRIWEQRYGFLRPVRQDGQHRRYTNEDLKTLLRVAYLYQSGYRISKIVRLDDHKMLGLIQHDVGSANHYRVAILQLTEAVVDFDSERFNQIFNSVVLHLGFEKAIQHVAFPLLQRLGLMWMTDNMIPAQEHFASNLIMHKIMLATDGLESSLVVSPYLVLLFAPDEEYHETGLIYLNYLLRKNGCRTVYAGPNVSLETLERLYQKFKPTHLHCYAVCNLQHLALEDYLRQLASIYPQAEIVCSGQAVQGLAGNNINGVTLLDSDEALSSYVHHLGTALN